MSVCTEGSAKAGMIYRLVGCGYTDKEIAERLHLSESYVESRVLEMMHSARWNDRLEFIWAASRSIPVTEDAASNSPTIRNQG